MPTRLHEELHEGMTRGPACQRSGRTALAALVATLLVLALGWASLSMLGDREARAQNSDGGSGGSGKLTQAAPEDGPEGASGGESEPSYAAFGEERNPFSPIVAQADDDGRGEETEGDAANDESRATASSEGASATANSEEATADQGAGGDDSVSAQDTGGFNNNGAVRQPFGSTSPGNQNVITGPNGERVDCGNPADEFEQLLCEDQREGFSASGGDDTVSGQQGPPGSGGSGRSGAGQPAEEFRNGGGGFVK